MNLDIEQYFVVRYKPSEGFAIEDELTWGETTILPDGSVFDTTTQEWVVGEEEDYFQLTMVTFALSRALEAENERVKGGDFAERI